MKMKMDLEVDDNKEEENSLRLTSHSRDDTDIITKPHFYKIIVSPTLQLQKLRIPSAFIKEFGQCLLDYAYLRVLEGEAWKVDLTKYEGNVWFHNGWQAFAEHYSLKYGQFLVFRYEGNTHFQVFIFGVTGCEIEYPNSITTNTDEDIITGKGRDVRSTNTAFERAKTFRCGNPHFVVIMRPSHQLSCSISLSIPLSYSREHITSDKDNIIRLHVVPKGKTWLVKCCFSRNINVRLTGGLRSFVHDNHLRVGDACVFELINKRTKSYWVHIFRAADNG